MRQQKERGVFISVVVLYTPPLADVVDEFPVLRTKSELQLKSQASLNLFEYKERERERENYDELVNNNRDRWPDVYIIDF